MSTVIKLDRFRQEKQTQYMKRYRTRLDNFIRSRLPVDFGSEIIKMAEDYQHRYSDDPSMVWDYVELRELMLEFVTEQVAKDIYAEVEQQFWFDSRWINLESVGERCLSYMILGQSTAAKAK